MNFSIVLKTIKNLLIFFKKEDFFSKLKNDYPSDEEIERTKGITNLFKNKNGGELTQLYFKSDVLILTYVFEKFIKVSVNELGMSPLYCDFLPVYTWQCGLKYTGINLQTLQEKDLVLTLDNNIRFISTVMGDQCVKSDERKSYCI